MSLILKGIDIPEKKLMEMFESDNHICIGGHYYPLMIKDVIQIPKDHGNIIDERELKSIKSIQSADFNSIETIQKWIHDAPTILEAEDPKPSDIRPITGKLKYTLDVENGILTRGIDPEEE